MEAPKKAGSLRASESPPVWDYPCERSMRLFRVSCPYRLRSLLGRDQESKVREDKATCARHQWP